MIDEWVLCSLNTFIINSRVFDFVGMYYFILFVALPHSTPCVQIKRRTQLK